jgi:pectate lyase
MSSRHSTSTSRPRRRGLKALALGAGVAFAAGGVFIAVDQVGTEDSAQLTSDGSEEVARAVGEPLGWASENGGTTGGAGGDTVQVGSAGELTDAMESDGPLTIEVEGTIELSGMNNVASDKTLIGADGASIVGGGINVSGVSNVIIQNIHFADWDDDAVNIEEGATNVWVDHNTFTNGYDGTVDIKREADFITVSWNHVYDHDKSMLLGHDDGHTDDIGHLRVSYHHNYFDGSNTRHPRVRFGETVHVFNNYYRDNEEYGVASTMDAGVLVEGNYFEDVDTPTEVGYGSSADGRLVAENNVLDNSGEIETAGSVAPVPYSYDLDDPESIPEIVGSGAGAGNL